MKLLLNLCVTKQTRYNLSVCDKTKQISQTPAVFVGNGC